VGERVVTAEQLLAKHGIKLTSTAPGDYATTCPECSHKRKPVNQKKRCLGVHIDAKGACWCCAHCGWHGPKKGDGGDNFDALYDYHSADGQFLFQKVRKPPGTKNRFACRRRDGSGWVWNVKSIEVKPLYRLPEIIKAIGAGRIVLVVEGEKDADACWRIGLAATCNFDGTSDVVKNLKAKPKWRAEYSDDIAAGAWPERARKTALQGVGVVDDDSWLEVLLGDIRDVFTKLGVDEIGSERLIAELIKIEARPWAEYGRSEKPITQNKLARLLRPVTAPERIRVEVDDYGKETQVRGYKLAKLTEAFERYLPSSEGVSKCHTVINPDATGTSEIFKPSQAENAVTVGKCEKSNNDGLCDTVTVAKGHAEENASVRTNGQGARPASERVRRVTALGVSFGVVGPAPPGAPCLHCQMSEPDEIGGVVIVEGHGRLHEACAPVWITNQDRSK
jgi:Protein of unknown function (DUF3631)